MKTYFLAAAVAIATIPLSAATASAGTMSNACKKSDREAATRKMCNCIQQVADQTLSTSDQRLASTFFADPHKSQVIRQSDRRSDEKFWLRYKDFGVVVSASCGHLR